MKRLAILALIFLTAFSVTAANFSSFLEDHERVQKKLSNIRYKIATNTRTISSESSNLRRLKKDLKKINKRHKKIYKTLVRKFKIEKTELEMIKSGQKSMKLRTLSDNLDGISNAYELASANNLRLEQLVTDNKAKAYTQSTGSGAFGRIKMLTGNCMPTTDKTSSCNSAEFQTFIIVRELTNMKDSNKKEPLLTVPTNDKGIYFIDLNPGAYSLFVLDENNEEYCNSFDGLGNACGITIEDKLYSEINLTIDRAVH